MLSCITPQVITTLEYFLYIYTILLCYSMFNLFCYLKSFRSNCIYLYGGGGGGGGGGAGMGQKGVGCYDSRVHYELRFNYRHLFRHIEAKSLLARFACHLRRA